MEFKNKSRPYYQEYVNHMLRFYVREIMTLDGVEYNSLNYKTWLAVDNVFSKLWGEDKELIIEIFKRQDTIADNIYEVSKIYSVDQDSIWKLLTEVTKKIAEERGLI